MKRFSIKIKHKPERLTAAQARAIPIDDSLVENALNEIYRRIREVASHGESEIVWLASYSSDSIKEVVKQRLEDAGYHVDNTTGVFSWKISWREME